MPTSPILSIVISTYNAADILQRCLNSIYAQDFPGIEIVIVDGASKDGTRAVIEANAARIGPWLSQPDKGIYDAWNKALRLATGQWLYFIGADDVLHGPTAISEAMAQIARAPEGTLVAYGQIDYIDRNDQPIRLGQPWDELRDAMRSQMALPHQGVFHARALFKRFGGFDGDFQIAGDYKLVMQSLAVAEPFYLGDVVIADQYAGGKSGLRRNRIAALREFRAVQAKLGQPVTPAWLWAYAKGLVWKALSRFVDVK